MNVPPYGDSLRRMGATNSVLMVSAQDNPNLTVKINPGGFWINGENYVEYAGGSTANFTLPATGSKIDVVCLTNFGIIQVIKGESAASNPVVPAIPKNYLPLAFIYISAGITSITDDKVYDARPWLSSGGYPTTHNEISGRDSVNSHPISAIAELATTLDDKVSSLQHTNDLALKADADGTSADTFIFNKDLTGTPSSDVYLTVERGDSPNVSIRWNENAVTPRWEYTNDGTSWLAFTPGELAAFTPSNTSDWNVAPTTIADALNELASRLRTAGF